MPYVIGSGQSVSNEIRRIVRKQLKLAIVELTATDAPSDGTVHDARRHIKKARAALRLCRDALRPSYRQANRRLRRASRMLAPIADGEAVVRTFARLATERAGELPASAADAVCHYLEERQAASDRRAARHHVLPHVVHALEKERRHARQYPIEGDDYPLLAPGFERTIRRSRAAMTKALTRGTADHYHQWRRRVKDHWLQTRLLNGRCNNRLGGDAQRLDELDALLGGCHDLALLAAIVVEGVPLTRAHAAACLRVIRRALWQHRHAAAALGAAVYGAHATDAVDRAARAWRSTNAVVRPMPARPSCPHVA